MSDSYKKNNLLSVFDKSTMNSARAVGPSGSGKQAYECVSSSSYSFNSQKITTVKFEQTNTTNIKRQWLDADSSNSGIVQKNFANNKLHQIKRYPSDHKPNMEYKSPYLSDLTSQQSRMKYSGSTLTNSSINTKTSILSPTNSITNTSPSFITKKTTTANTTPLSERIGSSSSPITKKSITSRTKPEIWNPASDIAPTKLSNLNLRSAINAKAGGGSIITNPSATVSKSSTKVPASSNKTKTILGRWFPSKNYDNITRDQANNINQDTKTYTTTSIPLVSKPSVKKPLPGKVYIFNNEKFESHQTERRGSAHDVQLLTRTFKDFKFEVTVYENLKKDEIKSVIFEVQRENFTDAICIVIVILSHGARNGYISAKDNEYNLDDMILFPLLDNKTLTLKPKIFFIQACRGTREPGRFECDASSSYGVPRNVLKCQSTFEGYVAYRGENGSPFIRSLCKMLQQYGKTEDIRNVMSRVITNVEIITNNQQVPSYETSLAKPFVLGQTYPY